MQPGIKFNTFPSTSPLLAVHANLLNDVVQGRVTTLGEEPAARLHTSQLLLWVGAVNVFNYGRDGETHCYLNEMGKEQRETL